MQESKPDLYAIMKENYAFLASFRFDEWDKIEQMGIEIGSIDYISANLGSSPIPPTKIA